MRVPRAPVDVELMPQCVLWLDGDAAERGATIRGLLEELAAGRFRPLAPDRWRPDAAAAWQPWPPIIDAGSFRAVWPDDGAARRLELRGADGGGGDLTLIEAPPLLGRPRCASIRVRFGADDAAAAMTRFAVWAIDHLPLRWGVAGWFLVRRGPRADLDWDRVAALGRRHWGALPDDAPSAPFDACDGITSVGWLTLVGHALLAQGGVRLPDERALAGLGLYRRDGRRGLALAAGPTPLTGDLHAGDTLGALRAVDELLSPLLLRQTRPWPGAFRDDELRAAWLGRFREPERWLRAEPAEL